jgi:hypothetical protein
MALLESGVVVVCECVCVREREVWKRWVWREGGIEKERERERERCGEWCGDR